jgi:di/tricarboxylate transporter
MRLATLLGVTLCAPLGVLTGQETHSAVVSTTDPVSQAIVAVIIVAVFVLQTLEAAHRVLVALSATSLLFLISYFTPYRLITFEGVAQALDINVLVLLASMMAVVGVLKTTGVFEWAVGRLMLRTGPRPFALLALIGWFTAVSSAFYRHHRDLRDADGHLDGASTQARADGLPPMIMASNIGGTTTLIAIRRTSPSRG